MLGPNPDTNVRGGRQKRTFPGVLFASSLLWFPLATGFVVRAAIVGPASPLTCQTGPRAVGWPVVPQISMVGTGAGEQKLRPVLLAITGATATSAGIVARVFGLSTSVVGSVVGLGGFAITATSLMKWWQDRDATIGNKAARLLLDSRVELPSSKRAVFMLRKQLAGALRATLERTAYAIVGGPRGCGKSTGVIDSLSNVTAVLKVKMGADIKVLVSIAQELGTPSSFKLTEMRLTNILRKTATLMKERDATTPDSWRPTIIAELNRNEVIGKYDSHVTLLKEIGADETLANVILVLSDADAVFAMPNDRDRQNQIWVEDLDEPGAHAYLDTLDVLPCDYLNELELPPCDRSSTPGTNLALRNKLFFEAGTRVMTLTSAAETQVLSQFFVDADRDGRRELRELVYLKGGVPEASGPAFTRLIKDLLEHTSNGWSPHGFDKRAENLGLPAEIVDEYLVGKKIASKIYRENGHCVLYHEPTDTYRFHSTIHRRAAENMFPEEAARGAAKFALSP